MVNLKGIGLIGTKQRTLLFKILLKTYQNTQQKV